MVQYQNFRVEALYLLFFLQSCEKESSGSSEPLSESRFGASPFCLVIQTEPNMDVCRVNRAVYGNFPCLALTFAEGACDKVPKTVRTFENFWPPSLLLVHHDFWQQSLFNLNLSYCLFYLFLPQHPTTCFCPSCPASIHSLLLCSDPTVEL